jgi:hypothetical protein
MHCFYSFFFEAIAVATLATPDWDCWDASVVEVSVTVTDCSLWVFSGEIWDLVLEANFIELKVSLITIDRKYICL